MGFAWKAAGLSYNRALAIAARAVRRSLKDNLQAGAVKRGETQIRYAIWQNGKQGEMKAITPVHDMARNSPTTE